jgi:peptide/nickel transport system substrate-binding protein
LTSNHSPLPNLIQNKKSVEKPSTAELAAKLESAGWKLNTENGIRSKDGKPLTFTISTADTPELKYTAQIIQQQLKSVGIATELHVFPISDLETSVIKPRAFEILLFGQLIRNDADLYAFWHSSQKSDPGLNITGYTQKNLDSDLEKLFITTDLAERTKVLELLRNDLSGAPVIWLYQPDFIYTLKKPIYGIELGNLISKHDRFNTIYQWYIKTDMIWNVFNK